jgi:hypothetical protein
VTDRPKLRLTPAPRASLEHPTIMDRALAVEHGAAYVQLAAFAIDVDRLYALDPDRAQLPFGWEVFLCEQYLLARIDAGSEPGRALIEDTCLAVLAQPPEEQGYGSQLAFAVYDAVARGALPESLRAVFAQWHKPPTQLLAALAELWTDPVSTLALCAADCLQRTIDPPLAPPTRSALEAMRAGTWLDRRPD